MSIIVGLAAVAIFTPFTFVKGLSSPADIGLFIYVMSIFPLILAAVSYSLLGLFVLRNPARASSPRFSLLRRTIAVLVLGFIIGGFTVGALAAGTENQLLSSAGAAADVTIPHNAGTPGNIGYVPANFNTTVGKTVAWGEQGYYPAYRNQYNDGIVRLGNPESRTDMVPPVSSSWRLQLLLYAAFLDEGKRDSKALTQTIIRI
ncbi:MAG TPA: hypothetical protein VFE98_05305 [Candidatus Bathyarchaeia archaeon]|nr:hypothetical protein [Candidatus Bathyarchaeia archaeon]